MSAPPHRAELPDHAAAADDRDLGIDQVGIRGLRTPIVVWDRDRSRQHTVATVDLSVGLPPHFKGTHMSRFVEVLDDFRDELSLRTVPELLAAVQRRLEADDARIVVDFPYFLQRQAPVSGATSTMDYQCRFEARRIGTELDFVLGVTVPVTTLCPCSKAISRYGAHNQRGLVDVRLRFDGMVWIEDVVEAVEACASSPVYALLKREDEKFVTERAYENPAFVEDLLRDVVIALRELPGTRWLRVEVENLESIHNHSAWGVLTWPSEDPTEAKRAPATTPTAVPEPGAWLRAQRSARGESQRTLAEALGISPSLVSRLESGDKAPSPALLDRLADHWGVEGHKLHLRFGLLPPALAERVRRDPEGFLAWAG